MGLISSDKFKPCLFVGLGGNGGKIVNQLAGRLHRHPHWDRIRELTHFLVIDTNKDDLDKQRDVPQDCRFLVSAFDNAAYVNRKRGHAQNPADPLVTQWIPDDYRFRSTQGAGAGQIRMESRLRLYYNLEDDRAGIRRKIGQMLKDCSARENPWRDNQDRVVRVLMYCSIAGGTGAGGFLPVAYLLRRMVEDDGWGRPSVTAFLSLPTTFLQKVKPQLHDDIKANGYASLKELEFLTRQLGYAGGMDEIRFHYDPGALDDTRHVIQDRPFDLTYLIDQPADMSIDRYEHAVADASFLQIFSPLLGHQAGEYDNYEKHQKQLASGHFSVHYGAFGIALLQLPRNDLVRYASLRYVARAFREYLCFGGEDPEFRVQWGDPAFERLAPDEKNKRIDDAFVGYLGWRRDEEVKAEEKGIFTAIMEENEESHLGDDEDEEDGDLDASRGGGRLVQGFQSLLEETFAKLAEEIDVPDFKPQEITEGNPSVTRQINALRRSYKRSRGRVMGEYLSSIRTQLKTGSFLEEFFRRHDANPISQRLFLIRLMRRSEVVPFPDPEEGRFLVQSGARFDLDAEDVKSRVGRLNRDLGTSAEQGALGRMLSRENKAFNATKRKSLNYLEELSQDQVESLQREFWQSFIAELRHVCGQLLAAFRTVAEIADTRAREAETSTESFRKDPAVFPDSDVAQYYLDAEVLRDDHRRERLWDVLYLHHLDRGTFFRTDDIFPLVTAAFQPRRDTDGQTRARDASEIVEDVREGLEAKAGEIYTRALGPGGMNLTLASALDLEQRYIALMNRGADIGELRRAAKLDDEVAAVPGDVVRRGIEDKLKRLADECVLLAHIDTIQRDDPTVTPADVFYAGLAAQYDTDEPDSLGHVLHGVVSGLNFVSGWSEPDALVLYRAILGIPVYFFKNVQGELYPSYRKKYGDPHRSYPLHIESGWEKEPGIPNLDPVEIRIDEERRQEQERARRAAAERQAQVRAFSLCNLFGSIVAAENGYAWSYEGVTQTLGEDRAGAFQGFEAMRPMQRDVLIGAVRETWRARMGERRSRTQLAEELQNHLKRVRTLLFKADAADREAEQRFVEGELAVVEALIQRVEEGATDPELPGRD